MKARNKASTVNRKTMLRSACFSVPKKRPRTPIFSFFSSKDEPESPPCWGLGKLRGDVNSSTVRYVGGRIGLLFFSIFFSAFRCSPCVFYVKSHENLTIVEPFGGHRYFSPCIERVITDLPYRVSRLSPDAEGAVEINKNQQYAPLYRMRRKAPAFRHGDIRCVRRICVSI